MGIADIPTKLGTDILIRTILPGLVAFIVFFEPLIYPLIHNFWDTLETFADKLLVWLIVGFAMGLFFMLCDIYIYQSFEGINWPEPLRKWKYSRIQKYFEKLDDELKNLKKQEKEKLEKLEKEDNGEKKEKLTTELNELSLRIRKLSDNAREFPPDHEKENFTKRYPTCPTRFGNVIFEYEDYSLNRYGIHIVAFWNHFIQVLSKETKEELKLKSAIADLCVYLCFVSFLSIIFGPAALLLQEESWIAYGEFSIPVKSIIYLLASIVLFELFYKLSITQHKGYGSFWKSIVDLNREELASKLGISIKKAPPASKEELENEKCLWRKYQNYYLDYKFLK